MQIGISKGKEIEFAAILYNAIRSDYQEPNIEAIMKCFNIEEDFFERFDSDILSIDPSVMYKVYERISNRRTITTNGAGKYYSSFATESYNTFLLSDHAILLYSVYTQWCTIRAINRESIHNKAMAFAYRLYKSLFEFKDLQYEIQNKHFNSHEVRSSYINNLPFDSIFNITEDQIVYEVINNSLIEVERYRVDITETIESYFINSVDVCVIIDDLIYQVTQIGNSYHVKFGKHTSDNIDEIDFRISIDGLFIENDQINDSETTITFLRNYENELKLFQEEYDKYKCIQELNPLAETKSKQKEAIHTFTKIIYDLVKSQDFLQNRSEHLIKTITGFITYDFGIITLKDEYLPSDNLSLVNDILRKHVERNLNSSNRLIL